MALLNLSERNRRNHQQKAASPKSHLQQWAA
jgi:hypothetical protein